MTGMLYLCLAVLVFPTVTAFVRLTPPRAGSYLLLRATALERCLSEGDADGAVVELENMDIPCSRPLAAKIVDLCANTLSAGGSSGGKEIVDPVTGATFAPQDLARIAGQSATATVGEEDRLNRCYLALKRRGLASKYAKGNENIATMFPIRSGGMPIEAMEARTNLPLASFRPSGNAGLAFWLLGAGLSGVEIAISSALHLDSPAPLFGLTLAALFVDQVGFRGAISEKAVTTLNPSLGERVVRHEAGHLLLAYLLGCPVQGCVLSAWEASGLGRGGSGAAVLNGLAGTAFFDPELNAAASRGRVTRSVIDRYSVVVMGGIAAEAMCYGAAEGGRDDEQALTRFLQQTVGFAGTDLGAVAEQARWAACNALLLLREERDLYERLVTALLETRASSIGSVVLAIEDEG